MDLLIIERGANWSLWDRLARTLRHPVHVLVQQSGECREDLYARVDSKIARSDLSQLNRIVVLGADGPRDVALSDVFSDIRRSSGADISALRLSVRHHLGEG